MRSRAAPGQRRGPVAGSPRARTAAAGWFDRRRLSTDPDQVVIAPGSKALLWALLAVLPGDVVLPQPSWVSYAAQAALAGKRVWGVPIAADGPGGVPRSGGARGDARRGRSAGPPSRGDRAHAARQPDGYRARRRPRTPHRQDRRRARTRDHLGRDLPRSRARSRSGPQPRRVPARTDLRHEWTEQEHGARRMARIASSVCRAATGLAAATARPCSGWPVRCGRAPPAPMRRRSPPRAGRDRRRSSRAWAAAVRLHARPRCAAHDRL